MSNSTNKPLPDQSQRDLILGELDNNLLVEAAAGTGKTTSMVGRMIALVAEGKCSVETLGAVTFTRKAAAELRSRFQVELEQAAKSAVGEKQQNLLAGAGNIERCFIGTIHSFCGRLLRERPIEAGVDLAFGEVDQNQDDRMRRDVWDQYLARLHAKGESILAELYDVGLEISQLRSTFLVFAEYPDVDNWPAEDISLPEMLPARDELQNYVSHIDKLRPELPNDTGNDKLMPQYRRIAYRVRTSDLSQPAELMSILELFTNVKPVQKCWPGGKEQALGEHERWCSFRNDYAQPLLKSWRQYRYGIVLRAIRPAVELYDQHRQSAGKLNFQDLLIKSADLLRDKPNIREYFRRRFTHLLVDEFQDTDPIQAEVMMFLTADDAGETDWRKCKPRPGSLFVVGDPKQSIYRFRRADIVTYNQVKSIIEKTGGLILQLSTNFRSSNEIISWVNNVFDQVFPSQATAHSPANVPLQNGRLDASSGELSGVWKLKIPASYTNQQLAVGYDANFTARFIRKAIDDGMTVARSEKHLAAGISPQVQPGDFLILARTKKHLGLYATELQQLGVPHVVSGGNALNRVSELRLLHNCLLAVTQSDSQIALVAALRGELFGLADDVLYEYKKLGGEFHFRTHPPAELPPKIAEEFINAFEKFRKYASWLSKLPPITAIEKIIADLGLVVRASVSESGESHFQVGSLAKAVELLRENQADMWSVSDHVKMLGDIVNMDEEYDAIPALPTGAGLVRLMTLHQSKGLEAAVVMLASPTGNSPHKPSLYVDRSGDDISGYMAVFGESSGRGGAPILAHPKNWEKYSAAEEKFESAETDRLRYVAATRATGAMIVSQRAKFNRNNPWKDFENFLAENKQLPEPGPCHQPEIKTEALSSNEITKAVADIAGRWDQLWKPSYDIGAAKTISLASESRSLLASGEHGTEWGSAIHLLLELLMKQPEADISELAVAVFDELSLSREYLPHAIETAMAVIGSDILQRAQQSEICIPEAGFQMLQNDGPAPTIVRGVIDLVFKTEPGWVIVDYKTDTAAQTDIESITEHYKPQVSTYAQAWEKATGQPVVETGLYFTKINKYIIC